MNEAHAKLVPGLAYTFLLCNADGPSSTVDSGLDSELSSRTADTFSIAIVGDLHLEQKGMKTFHRARQQLKDVLSASGSGEPRVVQLGDLGGYSEKPGESSTPDSELIGPLASSTLIKSRYRPFGPPSLLQLGDLGDCSEEPGKNCRSVTSPLGQAHSIGMVLRVELIGSVLAQLLERRSCRQSQHRSE